MSVVRKGSSAEGHKIDYSPEAYKQSPEARSASRNAGKEVKAPKPTHESQAKTAEERRKERLTVNNLVER